MNNKPQSVPAADAGFFCSWSGGKDSCLALHRACRAGARPVCLLTILCEDGIRSRSHGIRKDVLEAQAAALGIPMLVRNATWAEYEPVFIGALHGIGKEGVKAGVFGDIDFPPHLEWEEKVCAAAGMTACLPLWACPRSELLEEFLTLGYKAMIVTLKADKLSKEFLGRMIDREVIMQFQDAGIDPCGENGEYHTLVVDGPLFSRPLQLDEGDISEDSGYCSLDLRLR